MQVDDAAGHLEDGDDVDDTDEAVDAATPQVWFAMPVWRLGVLALAGGWVYLLYWMYGAWGAYRASWGYARESQWRAVHARTGFRVSPFWRAALVVYFYELLLVIQREARIAGVKSWGVPWLLALVYGAAFLAASWGLPGWIWWHRLLVAGLFLPAQATVNLLSDRASPGQRQPFTATEGIWLALGMLESWWWLAGGRSP